MKYQIVRSSQNVGHLFILFYFFIIGNIFLLNTKVLQRPNFGLCCFGHVAVIRRCDMIFWEFYGK
jgi:hypothetical protein